MTFVVKIKGVDKLNTSFRNSPKEVVNRLTQAVNTSVHLIRPIMRAEAPRGKTGKLRYNISAKAIGLEGTVGPNLDVTPYAWYVHQGTRPYTIRPRNKKALFWPGALHPVKSVKHPGIKKNPFVERTFTQMKKPVEKVFAKAVDNIIKDFHR